MKIHTGTHSTPHAVRKAGRRSSGSYGRTTRGRKAIANRICRHTTRIALRTTEVTS